MNHKISTLLGISFILTVSAFLALVIMKQSESIPVLPNEMLLKTGSKLENKTVEVKKAVDISNPDLTPSVIVAPESTKETTGANLCTGYSEEEGGMGESFPKARKYSHLAFLGELFTASDCGEKRVIEVNGGSEDYEKGGTVLLKNSPDAQLRSVLKDIGFICSEQTAENSCKRWKHEKTVPIKELLKLKPSADKIEIDDCIRCG